MTNESNRKSMRITDDKLELDDLNGDEREFLEAVRAMPGSKRAALLRVLTSAVAEGASFGSAEAVAEAVEKAEKLQ